MRQAELGEDVRAEQEAIDVTHLFPRELKVLLETLTISVHFALMRH